MDFWRRIFAMTASSDVFLMTEIRYDKKNRPKFRNLFQIKPDYPIN